MNRVQKMSWFVIIIFGIALILSLTSTIFIYVRCGASKAYAGLAFMGLAGLGGLAPVIFRRDKVKEIVDERDQAIQKVARLNFYISVFLLAGIGFMVPFFILGPKAKISVNWLPNIWMFTFLIAYIIEALSILILYGRDKNETDAEVPTEVSP